jgi:hypothetical protein
LPNVPAAPLPSQQTSKNRTHTTTPFAADASPRLEWLHDRMPVVLRSEEAQRAWLDTDDKERLGWVGATGEAATVTGTPRRSEGPDAASRLLPCSCAGPGNAGCASPAQYVPPWQPPRQQHRCRPAVAHPSQSVLPASCTCNNPLSLSLVFFFIACLCCVRLCPQYPAQAVQPVQRRGSDMVPGDQADEQGLLPGAQPGGWEQSWRHCSLLPQAPPHGLLDMAAGLTRS